MWLVPFFICPNCKDRSIDTDRAESLSDHQAVACHRCGFGFLFELMEDYYPAPGTGLIACDASGRILASGRGVFELTGYAEEDLIGREVVEALGLTGFERERNPAALTLEWGVRRLGEQLDIVARSGNRKPVIGDFFPAYDDDGGLLVAISPRLATA
jgi:PAS domain S-box-containing protein